MAIYSLTLSVLRRIGPITHYYNAGHNYIHTLQCNELAIMHGNRFSP